MITSLYDDIVVKINYNSINGSGVLMFNSDKTCHYLITAYHCICNDASETVSIDYNKIEVYRQIQGVEKRMDLNITEHVVFRDIDIILLIFNCLTDIAECDVCMAMREERITIVGFPDGLKKEDGYITRFSLRGKVNELPNNSTIQVTSEQNLETYGKDAKMNVSGYSGSGIFLENENKIYLCGIITELADSQGTFGALNGIAISTIDSKLFNERKEHLSNIEFKSFKEFKDKVLEVFDNPLENICSVQIPKIVENISPNDIINHCNNKIVWPNVEKDTLRNEVWETWLLYLIIRCIEDNENLIDEKFYIIKNETKLRKVKVLYATKHIKLPDFIKSYIEQSYRDINNDELIIIKTDKEPAKKRLSSDQVENIVEDISSVIGTKYSLYITEVRSSLRGVSVIHIQEIVNDMALYVDDKYHLEQKELEEKLGIRISEVLNHA